MRIKTNYDGTANVKHYLTQIEMLDYAQKSAASTKKIVDLKSSASAAAANYKSQIKEQEAIQERLVDAISSGFEMRDVACRWIMNDPNDGMKTLRRNDNYEAVDTKVMSETEKQGVLDLEQEREAEEEESRQRVAAAHAARADAQIETSVEDAPAGDTAVVGGELFPVDPEDEALEDDADTADDHGVKVKGGKRYISPERRARIASELKARVGQAVSNEEPNADFDADEEAGPLA